MRWLFGFFYGSQRAWEKIKRATIGIALLVVISLAVCITKGVGIFTIINKNR